MHYRSGGGNRRNRRGEIVLGLNAEGGGRWERGRIATSHDEHRSRGSEEEGGRLRDGSSLFTAACLLARRSNDWLRDTRATLPSEYRVFSSLPLKQ